ncbi:MAG: hypothetical protein MJZ34_15165 [Paludibacteraceae bacterium]|nr:hypothetical protein [Paludibacteraceae bacterium]
MAKTVFLSFANSTYAGALKRIKREAIESGFFNQVIACTENDLSPEYWEQFGSWIIQHQRGYGYWIWKSFLIERTLSHLAYGDFLVYLDSGCEVNKNANRRMQEYLLLAQTSKLGLVCFSTMSRESNYDKGDVLDFLGMRDDQISLCSAQIMGGIMIICKNNKNEALVKEWKKIIHDNLHLVDDTPSLSPNLPSFIENRHDQSIFSLLVKKYGGATVLIGSKEVEVWPMTNRNWRKLKQTPFHAVRQRSEMPRVNKKGLSLTFQNLQWDIENYIIDSYVFIRIKFGAIKRSILGKII